MTMSENPVDRIVPAPAPRHLFDIDRELNAEGKEIEAEKLAARREVQANAEKLLAEVYGKVGFNDNVRKQKIANARNTTAQVERSAEKARKAAVQKAQSDYDLAIRESRGHVLQVVAEAEAELVEANKPHHEAITNARAAAQGEMAVKLENIDDAHKAKVDALLAEREVAKTALEEVRAADKIKNDKRDAERAAKKAAAAAATAVAPLAEG